MKKGFTLIELLVVVLIIGILAAIALPQYTKAVEKSRMAEVVLNLGNMQKAMDIYMMSTPEATGWIMDDVLDIQLSGGKWDDNKENYRTKRFWYNILANGDGTYRIQASRMDDAENEMYFLELRRNSDGSFTRKCTGDKDQCAPVKGQYDME
ncbi:prepilin-type N-terminal cleavage/methylation domain-containing protein [Elusimicrobium posterum]|uniref:type IV pilin protein n=1 Tax=Elusimicrobium posterum TaxID=3116653 RepID=UPI003C74C08B